MERVGTYMHLSNGSLLKLQVDEEHVEMICEWADKPEHERMRTYGSLPLAEVPFMTGRPYTISSETDYAKAIFRLFHQVRDSLWCISAFECQWQMQYVSVLYHDGGRP